MELLQLVGMSLYVLGFVFALYMTRQERRANPSSSLLFSALSYVLCLAWPLVIVVMVVMARREEEHTA